MHPLLAFARSKQPEIIALIRELVECESPSDHPPSVNRFVDLLASKLEASQVRTFPGGPFGRHLRAEFTLPGGRNHARAAYWHWPTPIRYGRSERSARCRSAKKEAGSGDLECWT